MLTLPAFAKSLRKIEAELVALIDRTDAQHPIDPHELRVEIIRLGCQCEILEKGLVE